MLLVREVVHCKPGKVGEMVKRFRELAKVMERLGHMPFRLYTDVSGERFWTVVAESEVESLDAFNAAVNDVMGDADAQKAMAEYHDFVVSGRREIYRIET